MVFVPVRFGVVAFFAGFVTFVLFVNSPMTLQSSAWYNGYDIACLIAVAALTLYGFHTSLGGRRLLDLAKLER
jgi:hypothetical protein